MNSFKVLIFLGKGNRSLFKFPKIEQERYLNCLGEIQDDIDRSYKQYLCQNQFVRPCAKILVLNIVGAVTLPFLTLWYLIKRIGVRKKNNIECIIEKKGVSEVVPDEVKIKYNPSEDYIKGASLSFADLGFISKLIYRVPLHPYFVIKAMMHVAKYSDLFHRYHPLVMIRFWEFSFCSSVLTAYCHRFNVKHVDVMHGEKLFNIRDSFFHFDECYVWSNHYVELFKSLKAEPTQFHVALPSSMKIEIERYLNPSVYADYKYYLAIFSEEQIKSIVNSMECFKQNGKTIKFRPHPRYSDLDLLRKYVDESEIEYPKKVSIFESVSNLCCAVGSYTTVLSQAWFSGKGVVFDDMTFKEQYDVLSDLQYGLIAQNCDLLSSFQHD